MREQIKRSSGSEASFPFQAQQTPHQLLGLSWCGSFAFPPFHSQKPETGGTKSNIFSMVVIFCICNLNRNYLGYTQFCKQYLLPSCDHMNILLSGSMNDAVLKIDDFGLSRRQ
ncbi:hypothetical protein CRYUN_Cryun22dG0058400 [Craigia yunnanensis]